MVKKINTTTPDERTFFKRGSGGGGEGDSGSGAGSGSGDKAKGKEDPHSTRAKSVEDSSTKGEKSKSQHHSLKMKKEGEIRGRGSKYHQMKTTNTRESRMILMHSTSKKKSMKMKSSLE